MRQKCIIVVEDNPDNLLVVEDVVKIDMKKSWDGEFHGFPSGEALLQWLAENEDEDIKIILLDLQLPYMNGYDVLARLRSRPEFQTTQIVALTANVLPADLDKARSAGFNHFIGKPVDYERFPLQLQRILNGESVWESH